MDLVSQADLPSLKIVKYPHPVLSQPAAEVEQFGPELAALAGRMFEIMYASAGVGLAAPQVGVSIRMFIYNPTGPQVEGEGVCVNPRIVARDGSVVEEEGCLSLPGVKCKMKRFARVTVRGQDLAGEPIELTGEGLSARIFQHEVDHLDGMLLVDRMTAVGRLANRRVLKDLQEQYEGGGG